MPLKQYLNTIDFTGLGDSEGDFEDSTFSTDVLDLVDAAVYLTENYQAPKLIIGHSLGGAAVIFASELIDSIQAVVTVGALVEFTFLFNLGLQTANYRI